MHEISSYTHSSLYSKVNNDTLLVREAKDKVLLGVFDGVGKSSGASFASSTLVNRMSSWFNNVDDLTSLEIKNSLISEITKINNDLMLLRDCESTLALAIILNNETIISNVGDSRIYSYNDSLKQLSIDDIEFNLNKEYMRYFADNNIITRSVGGYSLNIHTSIINNNYNKLLLCTDGITKSLSDKKIEFILKNYDVNTAYKLVYEALYIKDNSYRDEAYNNLTNTNYRFKDIIPGIDDSSAIVYKRVK